MEDIAADDDLLSDMLLDSLEFEPKIATHKMNQAYRSPRYKTQDVIDIVRSRVVIECDVGKAVDDLLRLDVIKKHLAGKTGRQAQEFQLHARRYLETYLPDSGIEYALTTRYKQAAQQSSAEAQTSKAGQAEAQARAEAHAQAQQEANRLAQSGSFKGKSRLLGENGVALGTSKADLCVVATKAFKAGDLIMLCKGGVKDLTKSEDEALREEAAVDRERRKEQDYMGVLGQGRDFSVIRSARKGCSQLLLGPARFVNHDCDPNCEFHRLGHSQMVFKCLRNIGLNEEITTYYGDNYFEWENSECMCRTCESLGRGFFAPTVAVQMEEDTTDTPQKVQSDKQRRTSLRKIPNKSPPPARISPDPTTATIERNGKIIQKTFNHHISQREFDQDSTTHRGPKCTCLTCGTFFWAPEAWWMPDECRRCERHYRIFKADWPGRMPTEGGFSAMAKIKRREMEAREAEVKKRKSLHAPSPGVSSNSETDTPIKLSPLRDTEDTTPVVKPPRARKKQKIVLDDGTDEDAIEASSLLRKASPGSRKATEKKRKPPSAMDADESDLTSVSESDGYVASMTQRSSPSSAGSDDSSSSRPSGPKMLGKEAKTETLAMYWGAPTGDRRKRRQSHNGLESLAKNAKKDGPRSVSLRKEHRRNASDVSSMSAPTKSGLMGAQMARSEASNDTVRQGSIPDNAVDTASPQSSVASGRVPEEGYDSSVSLPPSHNTGRSTGDESPRAVIAGLATKGAARTSVKNLAMAWSAGVEEGGRGSRRRQPRDLSQPTPHTLTPPMHPQRRVSGRSDQVEKIDADNGKPEAVKTEGESEEDASYYAGETAKPVQSSAVAASISSAAGAPLTGKESPVSPVIRSVSINDELPRRHVSPLAGPSSPAGPFTNRPGVLPGQPIRKNLRWGSGKVSSSRPFVGPAAGASPLASLAPGGASESPQFLPSRKPDVLSHQQERSGQLGMSPKTAIKPEEEVPTSRASLISPNAGNQLQRVTGSGLGDVGSVNGASQHAGELFTPTHLSHGSQVPPLLSADLRTSQSTTHQPLSKPEKSWPDAQKAYEVHLSEANGHARGH